MTSYTQMNEVYRALDHYNFPFGISLQRQIHSLRVLYENRQIRVSGLPSLSDLQTRLRHISFEMYTSPNDQLVHEILDAALEFGVQLELPTIETQRQIFQEYERKAVQDIYSLQAIVSDSQNVHHTSINMHMKQIVQNLVQDYPPQNHTWVHMKIELQKHSSWRSTHLETLKFIYENPCGFTIGITLRQLLLSVYQFILDQSEEQQKSLYQRLNEELDDMRGKCSTGHLSRLVNVIQGFSERYTIKIQPKEEIKAFIYQHLTRRLQEAPEEIQDGMIEHTQEFKSFVLSNAHLDVFQKRFGAAHTQWIKKCMNDFVSIEAA